MKTHYATLQIVEDASIDVVKGAYRFLSQKWHPDKNPDNRVEADLVFRAINEAYAVLSDPARRADYDGWLRSQRKFNAEATRREQRESDSDSPTQPGDQASRQQRAGATPPSSKTGMNEKASNARETVGFWLQGICAFILVKTVGFLGALVSFASYFLLRPKLGVLGALVCSVLLGVAVGVGVLTLFNQGETTLNTRAKSTPAETLPVQKPFPSNSEHIASGGSQPTQNELLRKFLDEVVVNNKNIHYPIKINDEAYLTGRSIKDESERMFVVEDYRIITHGTPTAVEVLRAMTETEEQVIGIFCNDLPGRDQLFAGYSSVGLIQKITDANGNLLFTVKVDKSRCGLANKGPVPVEDSGPPSAKSEFGKISQYTLKNQTLPDGRNPVWVYYEALGEGHIRISVPSLDICVVTPESEDDNRVLREGSNEEIAEGSEEWSIALDMWRVAFDRYMLIGKPTSCTSTVALNSTDGASSPSKGELAWRPWIEWDSETRSHVTIDSTVEALDEVLVAKAILNPELPPFLVVHRRSSCGAAGCALDLLSPQGVESGGYIPFQKWLTNDFRIGSDPLYNGWHPILLGGKAWVFDGVQYVPR